MPGNEFGDRVHNFFAQDNSSQGQSHVLGGNWSVPNNNFWVGSPKQIDVLNSSSSNYTSQSSADIDRGQCSYPVDSTHGLNFSQSNLRPDFSKSQSLNEQPYSNGFYGSQFYQTRQNEANFLAMDTDTDDRHIITSRGLSFHELQQGSCPEQQEKASDGLQTSVAPVSFDLFGGQQQMNHQQASMLQAFQRQQSGVNDMQQLQQQLMIRKMQELQRQQQLRQLHLRSQSLINQAPSFIKHASGSQSSTLVNGTPNSEALQYPWMSETGTNWLSCASSAMQGSPSGHVFPPNMGQTQRLVDLVPQQVDQSLYGVPVSSSRGLAVNQYSQMGTQKSSMPQVSTSGNSFHSNQHNLLPDQISAQEGTSISREKFQSENMSGHASSQFQDTGIMDVGAPQQADSIQRNAPLPDFLGRRGLATRSETSHERPTRHVTSSEVSLDPTEEKILYGSDDNIWAAFGKSPNLSGGNLFDNGGLLNGSSSIQNGSWSALMQSAVGETSSSDIGPQEEWSGLNFHNTDGSSANEPHSMHSDNVKQASLPSDNLHILSGSSSGYFPPSADTNKLHVMGLNQPGHNQNEPGQKGPTVTSQRFGQSLEEASKWSNRSPLQKSVTEGNQIYGNAKTISATWASGQSGPGEQPNGQNAPAAASSGRDRAFNSHEADKLSQNSQNNQLKVMQGDVVQGNSLWKSNSVSSSALEFGPVHSTVGNRQANKGVLSLNDSAASVANSCHMGNGEETSAFIQNNYLINQWKNAYPSAQFQGGERSGRINQVNEHNQGLDSLNSCDKDEVTRHNIENCTTTENSTDSHRSNLSQHASGVFRESGDASDSKSVPSGKQKSNNQLARKVSVPRKFQYHPMGNLDENVERTNGLKQPTQVQGMDLQHTHFGQSKLFGQVPRNSAVKEKGELQNDNNAPEEEPSRGSFSGHARNASVPSGRPFDSYTPNKASSPSQNMLELLHKVDQSRNSGSVLHLSSSEWNVSSQPPEAEKIDGPAGRLQRTQSSVSQGFGLQLGPPSQRLQTPDLSSSSQNAQDISNPMRASRAGAEMGGKGLLMGPTFPAQSLPFPNEETQSEFKNDRNAVPGHRGKGNSLYKMPGNYDPAFISGTTYSRSQLQNNQITGLSGKMEMNQHTDSSFTGSAARSGQRGSAQTVLQNASDNTETDNLAASGFVTQQSGPNDVQERAPASTPSTRDQIESSQQFDTPGVSHQGASGQLLHSMWTNVPTQHTSAALYQKAPSVFSEFPQPNIVESSSQGLDVSKGGYSVSPVNVESAQKMEESLRQASSIRYHSDDSPASSVSTQKDIEAFGRTLKPNNLSNKKYALLNQMRTLKDVGTDPSIRVSKRIKGPDNVLDGHQVNLMAGQQNEHNIGDTLGSNTVFPSEDSKTVSASMPSDILQRNPSLHGNVAAEDVVALGLRGSENNPSADCTTSVRVEHHQVSPQMAPSWFNPFGTLKNGQMVPISNAQEVTSLGLGESPFTLVKSSSMLDAPNPEEKRTAAPIDACQVGGSVLSSTPTLVADHLSSPQLLQLNMTNPNPVLLRPKKRKSATSELHPWYKEISDGSQYLSTLSVAETDWNKAANRLTEKVEHDAELIEDGPLELRSKRRLILTTQLMQQLFQPPPATILSTDACSKYESVTYTLSRVVLGDACRIASCSSDLALPRDDMNLHPSERKLNGNPYFAKVVEELLGKARKLESDFLRLEKGASILDLRVECQDLEKFSVINRFAKFHGRGQTDSAEAASSDAVSTTQRPCAQRYVIALPMPRSLPDRVQCLSL
ncbi:uncharacterized protein LOC105168842 isoform X1 [Sesamum indicum]|uniref:Uncharacterized protein LOC105168842 isoform X1 n=1 Tax=Sesamum indicum TaxID=4182 RepID=A0A6I9TNX7_SESIN|nr:uncharacterized protein LOC105168842 isoform X1 [Sesamum indicum]XP_011087306.1 uncharacterized protein LOC105168842 isoform X1 [Sesamum indicum]